MIDSAYSGMGGSAIYWILFGAVSLISYFVQANLQRKMEKYSKVRSFGGLSGAETAEKMLHDNGLGNVKVTNVSGQLTDHYNPVNETVNLSETTYANYSVMAAAVAAHECGHAVQHAKAYGPLKLRTSLVPAVNFASKWMQWVILGGLAILSFTGNSVVLIIGICLFAVTTLFAFVTLPVEIDASRRAMKWLEASGMVDATGKKAASDALHAAAYTYVSAALGSLATLVYYILMFTGGSRR